MIKTFKRIGRLIELCLFFLYELFASSLRVAWEVLTVKSYSRPGIIAVPLNVKSDAGITLLANFVSLTPGSLALDVSEDRRLLYVHSMFIDDPDAERANIKSKMEQRVLEVIG